MNIATIQRFILGLGFGTSILLVNVLAATAFVMPDTDQIKCFDFRGNVIDPCPGPGADYYGQDASRIINPTAYTKLDENGQRLPQGAAAWSLVLDNITGLMWEVKTTDGGIHDKFKTYSWCDPDATSNGGDEGDCAGENNTEAFIEQLNAVQYGGFSDWRLPNRLELLSLARYPSLSLSQNSIATVDSNYFPNNTTYLYYWTSDSHAQYTNCAWHSYLLWKSKTETLSVRAVRAGQAPTQTRFVVNGDGTVTDRSTGLMWERGTSENKVYWWEALDDAETLTVGGYDDWRLPNFKELASIVAVDRDTGPVIDTTAFPDTEPAYYWSSTTHPFPAYGGQSLSIDFYSGLQVYTSKGSQAWRRAVRSPVIAAVTPASGKSTGGTLVTISGSGFGGSEGVVFLGDVNASVESWSNTKIACNTNAAPPGAVDVKIITSRELRVIKPGAFLFSLDEDGDGYVADDDCDDTDARVHTSVSGYGDHDGDGFHAGWPERFCTSGTLPAGYVTDPGDVDLDDFDAAVHPGASEFCDNRDNNQDGQIDEGLTCTGPMFPVPDTGQTTCYDDAGLIASPCPQPGETGYGQDGSYSINSPSFDRLGENGMVLSADSAEDIPWIMTRDNITGLIWELKTADDSIHNKYDTYTWCETEPGEEPLGTCGEGTDTQDFIVALNAERFGGFSDWRLPSRMELHSILNYGTVLNAIDYRYFPNVQSSEYWSSTRCKASSAFPECAMAVYLHSGGDGNYVTDAGGALPVMAVRGPKPADSTGRYTENGDGTVTDTATGLMWQQLTAPGTYDWNEALSYAESLVLGNHGDWRLPTIKELTSIVSNDFSPTIDPSFFPDTAAANYWSATSFPQVHYESPQAWFVEFSSGRVNTDGGIKTEMLHVRAVRGGKTALFVDSDDDGTSDQRDDCPNTPAGAVVDGSGCAASQRDSDGDGVSDATDQCPNTPAGTIVDVDGCAVVKGDINRDDKVDLQDAVLGLQIITYRQDSADAIAGIDGDRQIGLAEIIYSLQFAAQLRGGD